MLYNGLTAQKALALAADQLRLSKHATFTQFRLNAINVTQALLTHRNAWFSTTLVRSLLALQRNTQYNVTTVFLAQILVVQRNDLFDVTGSTLALTLAAQRNDLNQSEHSNLLSGLSNAWQ